MLVLRRSLATKPATRRRDVDGAVNGDSRRVLLAMGARTGTPVRKGRRVLSSGPAWKPEQAMRENTSDRSWAACKRLLPSKSSTVRVFRVILLFGVRRLNSVYLPQVYCRLRESCGQLKLRKTSRKPGLVDTERRCSGRPKHVTSHCGNLPGVSRSGVGYCPFKRCRHAASDNNGTELTNGLQHPGPRNGSGSSRAWESLLRLWDFVVVGKRLPFQPCVASDNLVCSSLSATPLPASPSSADVRRSRSVSPS